MLTSVTPSASTFWFSTGLLYMQACVHPQVDGLLDMPLSHSLFHYKTLWCLLQEMKEVHGSHAEKSFLNHCPIANMQYIQRQLKRRQSFFSSANWVFTLDGAFGCKVWNCGNFFPFMVCLQLVLHSIKMNTIHMQHVEDFELSCLLVHQYIVYIELPPFLVHEWGTLYHLGDWQWW